jgi:hypothetical protein
VPQAAPDRGGVILAFGILGIACCCFAFGIAAWVMGNHDLHEIDSGRMNPSGRGLTQAGRICGIVSVCLSIALVLLIGLLILRTVLPVLAVD